MLVSLLAKRCLCPLPHSKIQKLTQAACRQKSDRIFRQLALAEEGLGSILCKRKRHNTLSRRPNNQQSNPEPEKGGQRAESHVDVGIITAGPGNRRPQFGVAEGSQRREDPGKAPHDDGNAHRPGAEVDAGRRYEDTAADDGADYERDPIHQRDFTLEFDGAVGVTACGLVGRHGVRAGAFFRVKLRGATWWSNTWSVYYSRSRCASRWFTFYVYSICWRGVRDLRMEEIPHGRRWK